MQTFWEPVSRNIFTVWSDLSVYLGESQVLIPFFTFTQEECLHKNLKLVHYYDLKWVDDTHALAIFTDVDTADKALNIIDPYIKFRPFW